jgi:DNA-binding transcriptional ArsR family regulator
MTGEHLDAVEPAKKRDASRDATTQGMAGLRMSDILELPDPLRETVLWMLRQREVTLSELAARLGEGAEAAREVLSNLVARGFLWETRVSSEARYRARLAPNWRRDSRGPELKL